MKKAYIVNEKTKTITVDPTVKMSSADEKTIERYVKLGGYTYREKSKARIESAQRKASNLTATDIREQLKGDETKLNRFNAINSRKADYQGKTGFFAAKKWFLEECNKETPADKPKATRSTKTTK